MKISAMIAMLLGSKASAFTTRSRSITPRIFSRLMAATVDREAADVAEETTTATKLLNMEDIFSLCKQ
jgi:hypothetical protein